MIDIKQKNSELLNKLIMKMNKIFKRTLLFAMCSCCMVLYAQTKDHKVELQTEESKSQTKSLKRKVAISRFTNETQYGKGIFYDKENDPMAKQALDILSNKLVMSDKFLLLERADLDKIIEESQKNGGDYSSVGADYLIVGSITEFGRKNLGDANLISRTKTQIAEAAVTIRMIDVKTGQIIYSEEAKGEAELKSKSTLGVGASADYDATLSDKAISAAISKLTENIISNLMDRPWKAYFLTVDNGDYFISGGKSQGIETGDEFLVKEKGRTVKNPQTGMMLELPGKEVARVKVVLTEGDNPQNEFSIVEFTQGAIDPQNIEKYYIEEEK
ncbi:CsgG/HfaB family protein [Massilibacteroides sp.]|uniref:CsgG/HfaB family protein n=1 Tax=Massilibacteroides sp. TaxID=2034766 RepID=UPI002601C87A|nr:CsgG/HfaB family protein [Massilibacteroides sp.]MDD4514659.1 CsgG/HfaB family protein [Massilibacteroides sp.]